MLRWRFTLNPDTDNKVIAEPKGWDGIKFTLRRDRAWHGIFFEHTGDLGFYDDPSDATKDAYTFLRDEYELLGIEGHVLLKVEMACNDTDDYIAEGTWRMNFESMRQVRGPECWIEMNLETDDCLMTFKNRYDQPVSFADNIAFDLTTDLGDYTYLNYPLLLPPKSVLQQVNMKADIFADGTEAIFYQTDTVSAGTGTVEHDVVAYFPLSFPNVVLDEIETRNDVAFEGQAALGDVLPQFTVLIGGDYRIIIDRGYEDFPLLGASLLALIYVTTDADNTACGTTDTFDKEMTAELVLEVAGTPYTLFTQTDLAFCASGGRSITMDVDPYDQTFTLAAGDTIRLYARLYAKGEWDHDLLASHSLDWVVEFQENVAGMRILATTLSEATTCTAYLVNETGSRILEKITNDCMRLLSNYYGRHNSQPYESPSGLDGCGSRRALMIGLDIRQYTPGRFAMSFKKWFDDLTAIDNIGIGLEPDTAPGRSGYQVIRAEDHRYFYDETVVLTLDKIPLVAIEPIREDYISIFKGGYAKYEAEAYYGLDEFLTERNYRTNLTSTKNTLDQVCDMIASGYAIEITRRIKLYSPTTAEDWRFDNDIFIVCLNEDNEGTYTVEQGNITAATDMIDPDTIYNFRISPARNAMRWLSSVLNSYRDPQGADSKVIFTDGKGNILATGLMIGTCLEEAAAVTENQNLDYTVTDDPADALPVYVPEAWKFEYPLSFSEYQTLKANPRGTIQARFGQDADFLGFYLRMLEWDPNRQTASWELLPQRTWPIDPCQIYIVQTRGTGTNSFGSSLLTGAELSNLFVFVNGNLQKYNDADDDNNEIDSWDSATGFGQLKAPIPAGQQVTIFHLPSETDMDNCDSCIKRYEGRTTGTDTEDISGYGPAPKNDSFFFINGRLQKCNDVDTDNNEVITYGTISQILTLNYKTSVGREIRAFGAIQCSNILIYTGQADGSITPEVADLGIGTLANIFVFINGSLQIYNDSDTTVNQILAYDSGAETVTLNSDNKPSAGQEVRAFKLTN